MRWPDRASVVAAATSYGQSLVDQDPRVVRVGLFGSYASGDQGPGSDADLLVELATTQEAPERRCLAFPPPRLPVPADVLVLTTAEIEEMLASRPRWKAEVWDRMVWLARRSEPDASGASRARRREARET